MTTIKRFSKAALSAAVLTGSLVLTGCALAPGAYLDPSSEKSIDFNLVDINENVVNPEPVSRVDLAGKPEQEKHEFYQYLIGPHDVLSVRVWNNPDLTTNQKMTASPFNAKNSTVLSLKKPEPDYLYKPWELVVA